jgi:hypothetical protein
MATRSAKGAAEPLGLSGWRPAGAKRTSSRSNASAAAVAMARWPRWGGSKDPPKRAMRMGYSLAKRWYLGDCCGARRRNTDDT